jgi:hypothetical protein
MNGTRIHKPLVEKPASAENHGKVVGANNLRIWGFTCECDWCCHVPVKWNRKREMEQKRVDCDIEHTLNGNVGMKSALEFLFGNLLISSGNLTDLAQNALWYSHCLFASRCAYLIGSCRSQISGFTTHSLRWAVLI